MRPLALFALTAPLLAQANDPAVTFEAASIKPFPEGGMVTMSGCDGGPGSGDPGRIRCEYVTLKMLLMRAYGLKNQQIAGPGWLDSGRFDIAATVPPGATKDQVTVMFRNLLVERFQLAAHHETRPLPGYGLAVAKNGPKLKAASPPAEADEAPSGTPPRIGSDGFPVLRASALAAGPIILFRQGRARLQGSATMAALAQALSNQLDRVIADETGLTGKYDITLNWTPDPNEPGARPQTEPDGVNLFAALEQQLGLKLSSNKIPRDVLVVDRAERVPTGN